MANSNPKVIDLSNRYPITPKLTFFRNISDSDNIFDELSKFPDVEEVNLSDNNLTTLPNDLSIFQNLRKIDLRNNKFENVKNLNKNF